MSGYPSLSTLSHRTQAIINGDGWERYGSNFKALPALLGGLHARDWTCDQAIALCLDTSTVAGRRIQDKWAGESISQIQSKWRNVDRRHRAHDKQIVQWIEILLNLWPLDGRHGAKLRVALSLAWLAYESGSLTFTASQLRIGEIAGVGYASATAGANTDTGSVRTALMKLQELGIVTISVDDAITSDARLFDANTRYAITPPVGLRAALLQSLSLQPLPKFPSGTIPWIRWGIKGQATETMLHPVFEHRGLGMNACRVWHFLEVAGETGAPSISNALRLSRNGTHGALKVLDEHRMVERDQDGRWQALSVDLDEVADSLGTLYRQRYRQDANSLHRKQRKVALQRRRSEHRRSNTPSNGKTRIVDHETGEILSSTHLTVTEHATRCDIIARSGVGPFDNPPEPPGKYDSPYVDFDYEFAKLVAEYFLNDLNAKALV